MLERALPISLVNKESSNFSRCKRYLSLKSNFLNYRFAAKDNEEFSFHTYLYHSSETSLQYKEFNTEIIKTQSVTVNKWDKTNKKNNPATQIWNTFQNEIDRVTEKNKLEILLLYSILYIYSMGSLPWETVPYDLLQY